MIVETLQGYLLASYRGPNTARIHEAHLQLPAMWISHSVDYGSIMVAGP